MILLAVFRGVEYHGLFRVRVAYGCSCLFLGAGVRTPRSHVATIPQAQSQDKRCADVQSASGMTFRNVGHGSTCEKALMRACSSAYCCRNKFQVRKICFAPPKSKSVKGHHHTDFIKWTNHRFMMSCEYIMHADYTICILPGP